jgi:hypothetical protein
MWESALSQGGERVGRDVVKCTLGIRTFLCDATGQIAGRGKITVSGAFFGGETQIAVTGGTGDFQDARGELFAVDQPDGTTRLIFHLVD